MKKHSASVVGPDPDGLYWITLEADEIRASIPVKSTGIVAQVMAAFTGQPALVPQVSGSAAVQLKAGLDFAMQHEAGAVEAASHERTGFAGLAPKPDDLLDNLQRAIDRAEHKPEQWADTCQSMGGVCTKRDNVFAEEDRWGSFSHKRDAWLAVAAVNASPALMERVRAAEAEVVRLRQRLEITYDGIATRDATIKALQERVDQLKDLAVAGADSIISTLDSQAARDVLAERRRQVEGEGWSPEHDDEHIDCDLAAAAACYALGSQDVKCSGAPVWPGQWAFKPAPYRRMLIKSGALLLAEIERLDRAEARCAS